MKIGKADGYLKLLITESKYKSELVLFMIVFI